MVRSVTDDDTGLKVLREPDVSPEGDNDLVDIIAVHGIGAHPDDSWTKNVGTAEDPQWVNWLEHETMLPSLAPHARIMRYGYQSRWFGKEAMAQTTPTIAQRLLLALRRARKADRDRPLIFITHCFGGLVVLKSLLDARGDEDEWPGIFVSTTGLIFLGTPFRGTDAMSQIKMLEAARRQCQEDEIQTQILKTLEPGNEFLQDLVDRFGKTRTGPNTAKIARFYELKSTNVGIVEFVVNQSSGCLDISEATTKFSLSRTHFNMNKFGKRTEEDFQILGEVIEKMVEEAHTLKTRRQTFQDPRAFEIALSLSGTSTIQQFVAREDELAEIDTALRGRDVCQTVILHGLGGIGKTQLAIAYALRHRNDYSAVFWFNTKDEASIQQSFATATKRILAQHTPRGAFGLRENGSPNEQVEAVKRWLDQPENSRWLLIYDNYDNPKLQDSEDDTAVDINQFLPTTYHGSVLITARSSATNIEGQQLPIQKLKDPKDSLAILANTSGRQDASQDPDALKLAQRLDGLPLALATAGAYLSQVTVTFGRYLQLYEESWLRLQKSTPRLSSYDQALYSTWQLSFDHIKEQNEHSTRLLEFWAYFDNQDLWYELLKEPSSDQPEWLRQLTDDELEFTAAVRLLCNHGLAEVDSTSEIDTPFDVSVPESNGYSMHSCVHSWTTHVLNQKWNFQLAGAALGCVSLHLEESHLCQFLVAKQRRLMRHATRCSKFVLNEQVKVNERERHLLNLGSLYMMNENPDEAVQMYERAMQGYEETVGPEHRLTLQAVGNLSILYAQRGRLEEARQMCERALCGYEKDLGSEHEITLNIANNLGTIYAAQNNLEAAEQTYCRVLGSHEGKVDLRNSLKFRTIANLGALFTKQGKPLEAEKLFKQTLQAAGDKFTQQHFGIFENLGSLYVDQDRLDEAEAMLATALGGYAAAFGKEHKRTLKVLYSLGALLEKKGDSATAEEAFKDALGCCERVCGPEHRLTLRVADKLVRLYVDQGKLHEAEQVYERALKGYETTHGPVQEDILHPRSDYSFEGVWAL